MPMTHRQRECFEAIEALTVGGVAPTLDEIKARLGLQSKGNVCRLVSSLERDGYITRAVGRARNIQIVRAPDLAEHLARLVVYHGGLPVCQALDAAIKAIAAERG